MLVVAIGAGLLIGVCLGALGGGGSILTVPVLVYLLNQSAHAATTGSLVVVGAAALAGVGAHVRAGTARIRQGLAFGGLGVLGSYAGSRVSAGVNPDALLAGFALLMVGAAIAMLRRPGAEQVPTAPTTADAALALAPNVTDGWSSRPIGTALLPERPGEAAKPANRRGGVVLAGAATGVGLLTGFFGVGGGFVVVPVLVVLLGYEMPVAVGTSLVVIAINSASALAARVGAAGDVDWTLVGALTAAAAAASLLGQRVARRVPPDRLATAFSVLLFAVAAYTAARSIPRLF
jgi:uncharacterized membrane protein YfcA